MSFRGWLLGAGILLLLVSGIRPYDRFTWFLEIAPILLGLPVLVLTRRRFPLTDLACVLIFVHAGVLMVGGHYTYARVPLFDWIRDAFHLSRNHYDRVGHFMQGFVPALLFREIIQRTSSLKRGLWLAFTAVCFAAFVSLSYELIEWRVAVGTGSAADDFLGTQGDVWDTQKDMAFAVLGAVIGQWTLGRTLDRQIQDRIPRDRSA